MGIGGETMKQAGKPKKNGSGMGTRANKGRGGCSKQQSTGKGKK